MFDEQWQFAVEVERKYNQYRKKVMVRYDLSAAEVDVLLFLANNSQFDLAVDIVRVRKMQKSHVSLAVNKLCEKGYIQKETDAAATIAADLLKRQRSFPLPFLLPFFCFLLFLFFLFQTFQIYFIKRIAINDKFLFFFRFHNHIPLKNFFYI